MYAANNTNISITTLTPSIGPAIPSTKIDVSRIG
jgi:hypothetical protein